MASESIVGEGGGNDGVNKEKQQRYTEHKVYTRKAFKGPRNNITRTAVNVASAAAAAAAVTTTTTAPSTADGTATVAGSTAPASMTAHNNNTKPSDTTTTTTTTVAAPADVAVTTSTTTTITVAASADVAGTTTTTTTADTTTKNDNNDNNTDPTNASITTSATAAVIYNKVEGDDEEKEEGEDGNKKEEDNRNSNEDDSINDKMDNHDNSINVTNNNAVEKNAENNLVQVPESQIPAHEDAKSAQKQPVLHVDVTSDDSSTLNREQMVAAPSPREAAAPSTGEAEAPSMREDAIGNGAVKQGLDNKVRINLASKSKKERRELRRKLESELELVRSLAQRIEAEEGRLGIAGGFSNGLRRAHSEVGSVGVPRESTIPVNTPTPRQSRPLNQLSISVLENSLGVGESMEKEKRTPKANQFYRNSEFLLAKDKFPPAESNKKSKSNGKKHGGADLGHGFGAGTKMFKNCSALLDKLMKHKHGWIFNTPVDVVSLGLHDYFSIIQHPMDLGTVKSRLNKNWYKSSEEFAEDVRLTFHNALRYNPEGQDVHVIAGQLLKIFEDKWAILKSDYDRETRFAIGYDVSSLTPTSRKSHSFVPPPLDMRILDRSQSMTYPPFNSRPKLISPTPSGRTPALKKPKAKDPHKRDMTYDEKQKLSNNLQNLPSEKLDNIVQIIKKRNSAVSQHDDEIEVDIDGVDVETLWELDRFVTNYKKSLSKNKRKAELALQARLEAEQNAQLKAVATVAAEAPKETVADERNISTSSPVQVEKQGDNGNRSSSSSSSSSDSGSSSSDSDSDSSSLSGSDVGP